MIVAFDNNVLSLLVHPEAEVPNDPNTGKPIDRAQERIEFLLESLSKMGARILIPSPVLSEFLTYASTDYLDEINASQYFEIAPFDQRAAIEAAIALRRSLASALGKKLGLDSKWQKIKIDRQIVAIAKVNKAEVIFTTDKDVIALAQESGIKGVHVADLAPPPSKTPLLDAPDE